jgi:type IV pilus assembly protein PilB
MKRKRLGDVLRERGHISHADLTKTIEDQHGKLIHLGELLLQRGVVSKAELASALTEVIRIPYVDCQKVRAAAEALQLLPHALAKRCCALPVEIAGKTKIAMVIAEPQNLQIIDELRFSTGMEIEARLGFRDEILKAIEKCYSAQEKSGAKSAREDAAAADGPGLEFISSSSLQRNIDATHEMQADLLKKCTPAVQLAASTITAAADKQASDIHIEPQATDSVVRLRVDGILRDYQRIPQSMQSSVVSRIKILANLDIGERKTPQEGRFAVKVAGRRVELRVSTLPTQYGEKLVIRLLGATTPEQDFASLGFPEPLAEELQHLLCVPQGMILVTGPKGSGKSTTLYSALNFVRKPSINIVTVEDPVDYAVPGLNQVRVNTKAGLTYASCLKSVLRQDPNVIMIGEIRDSETAEIALKAAQTGQLVLSTLHTNDSVSAITRLTDLGLTGSQIATSLVAVVAQRLVRRLCACHKIVAASPETVSRLKGAGVANPPEMESVPMGCEICDLTGYKGRVGVFELLTLNESVCSAVRAGKRNEEVRALARQNGMKLMQDYALEQVRAGLTTLEEVARVIPFEPAAAFRCSQCDCEISPAFLFCPFCGAKSAGPKQLRPGKRSLIGQGAAKNEF